MVSPALGCSHSPKPPDADVAVPTATAAAPAPLPVEPTPAASAVPAPALQGDWIVQLRSESRSSDAAAFPPPETRAAVFFDYEATVVAGRVEVTQRALGKTYPVNDAAGAELDALVRRIDWPKMKMRVELEEAAMAGATVHHFVVTRGGQTVGLRTTNVDRYPDLLKILKALHEAAGVPK